MAYSQEQIYEAMRRADAAGDGDAVKALAAALKAGASKGQINEIAAQNNLSVDQAALDANIASRDAGGPTSEVLPPKRPTLGMAAQNALAGAAQGAAGIVDFPMMVAGGINQGVNYLLTEPPAAALDAFGATDAANALRGTGERVRADQGATTNALSLSGAIERLSPTPEGMGGPRLAAQFIGGLAVPFGPKGTARPATPKPAPASEAREVIEAGQREGVRVMTSDVKPPRSFMGKLARATGERIPFAGTGGARVRQNEERIEAVKGLAREYGVDGGEEVIESVAKDLAKTRGGRISALANRKNRVIDNLSEGGATVATPNAVAAIDQQIARLAATKNDEVRPVIEKLEGFKRTITSGLSLRNVEENRKILGSAFEGDDMAKVKDIGQKAVNAIYAPLRDDMGAYIKANAGDEAFTAWKSSNDELAAMAGELDAGAFKRVLQNSETTPENVASLLFSKKPSDVRRLYANLSEAGKEKAKGAVLHQAITKAGGIDDLSPQRFANSLKDFGRTTGIIFGDDAPRIEGVVKLLRATQQASVAAAAPPTGVQNAPVIGAAVLTDWMGGLGAATTTAGLAGAAARLYESAPIRNLLVGLGKSKPGSKQEGKLLARIEKVLTSQTGINGPAAMNDNIGMAAVAQPNE